MKTNKLLLMSSIIMSTIGYNQSFQWLEHNNAKALLNSNGIFFNDILNGAPAYQVPTTSNASMIYASAFWFGGVDESGSLHLSASKYGAGQDLFSGPISNDYNDPNYLTSYNDLFWTVTKSDIDNHIQNYQSNSYTIPSSILGWPGNGNTANGEAQNLAPYIDQNTNGIYDPENGDYPNIRGDQAVYMIANDAAGVHSESGGDPLGMEFHFMFYQYLSNDYINNTTFINVRVFNRSQTTYENFRVAQYTDSDIGNYNDDYVGCAPDKNMMFAYNADNYDESSSSASYEENPPALGIKLLNHNIDAAGYYSNSGGPNQSDPSTANQYWGYMNAEWSDSGIPFTEGGTGYGGTNDTKFLFSDNPNNNSGWSEVTEANLPSDRRMYMCSEGVTFQPNQSKCYDYAILYNRNGNNLENVNGLYDLADSVQNYYDSQTTYSCETVTLGIRNESTEKIISTYPNPSNGNFTINLNGIFDISILSITGEFIIEFKNINSDSKINTELSKGIYILQITQNNLVYNKKIVIN